MTRSKQNTRKNAQYWDRMDSGGSNTSSDHRPHENILGTSDSEEQPPPVPPPAPTAAGRAKRSNSVPSAHHLIHKEVINLRRQAATAQKMLDDALTIADKAKARLNLDERILITNFPTAVKQWLLAKVRESDMMTDGGSRIKATLYIESVLRLPLDEEAPPPLCLTVAQLLQQREVMDIKMFGQEYLKDEIVATLTRIITADSGSYVAFSGPPGIGKTMAAQILIADTLNIPFFQLACGGLSDPALLLGHSSTYVGAKPGHIALFAEQAKGKRAVVVLDEIDKIESDAIWGVLTHLLDKTQNEKFYDHFYGNNVPIDLSRWIFVVTFNDESKVNRIVKDRMKIIHIPDYTIGEKREIAKTHILPNAMSEFNLAALLAGTDPDELDCIVRYVVDRGLRTHVTGMRGIKLTCESLAVRLLIQLQEIEVDHMKLGLDQMMVRRVFEKEDRFLSRSMSSPDVLHFYS